MTQIGAQYSWRELYEATRQPEPIVHAENGNRSQAPQQVLRRLRKLLPRLGITRVAEISQLFVHQLPVFQAVRPNILYHAETGQNTGSQGKGRTRLQARLSAMMESIESYCAEPRVPILMRASYEFLRTRHVVLDPVHYVHRYGLEAVQPDEPLMWTHACCLHSGERVLVPAEMVYFPFFPYEYGTQAVFSCSTNGLASGSTCLEALIHALYELIERHYTSFAHLGRATVHELEPRDVERSRADIVAPLRSHVRLRYFTLHLPGVKNLPAVLCMAIDGDGKRYIGAGCCGTVDVAIDRALTEAVQVMATAFSGAREDLDAKRKRKFSLGAGGGREFMHLKLPDAPDLSLKELRRIDVDRIFKNLREEYRFLLKWLREAGFPNAFAANLTRHGIDVPVVKALVPGMMTKLECLLPARRWTHGNVSRMSFFFDQDRMVVEGFT